MEEKREMNRSPLLNIFFGVLNFGGDSDSIKEYENLAKRDRGRCKN